MATIIITRHAGMVAWLTQHGISGQVIAHATAADVHNQDVIGVLPLHLAALASSITTVDMPALPPDKRGVDLDPDEMTAYGAVMRCYQVKEIDRDDP